MGDINRVHEARERLAGVVRHTPLLSSPAIDRVAGRRVMVKAECLQHTGSFKFRGAWSAATALSAECLQRGLIAFSSGNHAQGVAKAAQLKGVPACIIMPSNAPDAKIEGTRSYGAEVVGYDRDAEDRESVVARVNETRKMTLIKPFDDEMVIAGQGTCGIEIAEQSRRADVDDAEVLVPCGGGGLTSGIALALEAHAPRLRVRPCEPVGFDDVARSLKSGRIERNQRESGSICDAIVTPSPGVLTFPILSRLCGPGIVVSDDECLSAMALAFTHLKIVIEPGGAAALAAAVFHGDQIERETVIVVASGGNVDRGTFERALATQ